MDNLLLILGFRRLETRLNLWSSFTLFGEIFLFNSIHKQYSDQLVLWRDFVHKESCCLTMRCIMWFSPSEPLDLLPSSFSLPCHRPSVSFLGNTCFLTVLSSIFREFSHISKYQNSSSLHFLEFTSSLKWDDLYCLLVQQEQACFQSCNKCRGITLNI